MSTKPQGGNSVVGKPIDRVDGKLKVTGQAKYSADISLPNMAYAAVVQSTISAGKITAIDTAEAEKVAGVLAVLTHQNAPRLKKSDNDQNNVPILQDNIIRFAGQNIAVVVADTFEIATHAADLVKVTYAPSKSPNTNPDPLSNTLFEQMQKSPGQSRGDFVAGMKNAAVKIEATYTTPTETHNPMEPFATVAHWEGDKLTVYETTQGVFPSKKSISEMAGIPANNITVITHFLGGGFGCKLSVWSHAIMAVLAAKQVKRPVKLVLKRTQMYGPVGFRPKTFQQITLGATKQGKLTAMKHLSVNETSLFRQFTEYCTEPTNVMYACPNVTTAIKQAAINIGSPTWMRAPGDAPGSFALESAMDELAYALGIDPIELRVKNFADKDPESGKPWSSNSLLECYKVGAQRFGWAKRSPAIKSMKRGKMQVGLGVAAATHPTYRSEAGAIASISSDGTATIKSGTQDIGTGTYTIMAQVAADILGLPINKIKVELGDTRFPQTPLSGGSQTAASVGSAVTAAAKKLLDALFDLAIGDEKSPLQKSEKKDLEFRNGVLTEKGSKSSEKIGDLLKRNNMPKLEVTAKSTPAKDDKYAKRSFGVQFAEVEVEPDLGRVHVTRMLGAYAAGKILNEKTARSQMLGGMIWGMGMTLFEETLMDHKLGRIVNNDFAEYHIPVHADMPSFDVIFIPEEDPHVNPVGAKGVGELAINGAAAAIANAIYHATGKRLRHIPITLDQLF